METNASEARLSIVRKIAVAAARGVARSMPAKVGFGLIVLLVLLASFSACLPKFSAEKPPTQGAPPSDTSISPSWAAESEMHAFVLEFQEKVPQMNSRLDALAASNHQHQASLDEIRRLLQEINAGPAAESQQSDPTDGEFNTLPPMRRTGETRPQDADDSSADRKTLYVPATSRGHGTMLFGVFAGLDDSVPVIIRLDEVLVGPNRTRIPIAGAALVGRGIGEANTETVHVTLTTLSYVDPDLRAHELSVSGFLVSPQASIEDPERATEREGIPGRYVYRWDKVWPLGVAAGISGASDIFQMSRRRVRVGALGNQAIDFEGDEFAAAGFAAVGAAADEFAAILAERAREMRPAIAVDGGVRVRIVFDSGFAVPVSPELLGSLKENAHEDVDSPLYRRPR